MKVLIALLVAVVVAAFCAAGALGEEGYGGGYGHGGYGYYPGFHHVHNGVEAVYRNDLRQLAVNSVAEHYGAGTGTARWNGVPGTGLNFGYGHGYGHHGGY